MSINGKRLDQLEWSASSSKAEPVMIVRRIVKPGHLGECREALIRTAAFRCKVERQPNENQQEFDGRIERRITELEADK